MRCIFISILLFSCITGFCQARERRDTIPSALYYATVKGAIYRIENADLSMDEKRAQTFNALAGYIADYPKEEMNFSILAAAVNLTRAQVKELLSRIDSTIYASPFKAATDQTLKRLAVTETGRRFPNLILIDTLGNSMSVGAYAGKIVLIDAWSSWCVACRQQVPDLKKVYKRYNDQGFEIIGISMDSDKAAWLKAIDKDKQTWKQYCDLTRWEDNKFAKQCYISAIPANYLLDRNGIILGQDLSPGQVESILAKMD